MNTFTSSCPEIIRIPPYFDRDREVLEACFTTLPLTQKSDARIVHIQNTLHLETLYISETMLEEARADGNLEIIGEPGPMAFDEEGNISTIF